MTASRYLIRSLLLLSLAAPCAAHAGLLDDIGDGLGSLGDAVGQGVKQGIKQGTQGQRPVGGNPTTASESVNNHIYNESNCPGIGSGTSAAEQRRYAECVDRDAGFTSDWDAMHQKHLKDAKARQAAQDKKFKDIQSNSDAEFAKIKAQSDAAAAQEAEMARKQMEMSK